MQFTSTLLVALLAVSSSPTLTTAQQVSNLRGARQLEDESALLQEEALSDDYWFDDCPVLDAQAPKHDIRVPNHDEKMVKKCQAQKGCVWTCPTTDQILCFDFKKSPYNYEGLYCHNGKYS